MTFNPELRRNLWLQLSAHRLIAMPVVLAIVFGLTIATTGGSDVSLGIVAYWGFYLIALVWGTRRAAEAIAEEVNGGTWDSQRMSSLGAWTMTWGKLLGSTVYQWYGAAICLVVLVIAHLQSQAPLDIAYFVALLLLTVVIGQVVAMGTSLALWRKQVSRRHLRWAVGQTMGMLAGVIAASRAGVLFGGGIDASVQWYDFVFPSRPFWSVSLAVALGWVVLGAYRLMRQELQYRNRPWAWAGFVLYVMAFLGGFSYVGMALSPQESGDWRWQYVAIGTVLVYLALFVEPKSIIGYRLFIGAARRGALGRSLEHVPLWLVAYLLTWIAALAVLFAGSGDLQRPLLEVPVAVAVSRLAMVTPATIVAALLFVLRDAGLVLALNFSPRGGRADMAAFLYLAMAYGPLAWLAALTKQPWLVALLLPLPSSDLAVTFVPVLLELAVIAIFLWVRWRRYAVPRVIGAAPLVEAAGAGVAG